MQDIVSQCSEMLARQIVERGSGLNAANAVDMQRIIALQAINPAASVLGVMSNTRGIHPLNLYMELARLSGTLDLLCPQRQSQRLSPYDHERIGEIFFDLKRRIQESIGALRNEPYHHFAFVGYERGLVATLDRPLLVKSKRFFLGVQLGDCEPNALCTALAQGQIDWKIGATRSVERLFAARAPGIEVARVLDPPTLFPNPDEWVYFEIQDTGSTLWKEIESTGSISIRFCESVIQNPRQLPGQRHIELQLGQSKHRLQFSILGVP
jgi:predicted component of type VI protein secretion system